MIVGFAPLVTSVRLIILIGRRKQRSTAKQLLLGKEEKEGEMYWVCIGCVLGVYLVCIDCSHPGA